MGQTLKQEIGHIGQVSAAGLFSLAVVTLVLIHVFGIGTDDFTKLFASNVKKVEIKPSEQKPEKGNGNEIHQYTEFVTVNHPSLNLSVTTGIRFDNSKDQNVESQWCYASHRVGQKDGYFVQLNIQKIISGKVKKFGPYSVQTLHKFNLTRDQAINLITYCRFKAL